jgi:translation initiation factor 1
MDLNEQLKKLFPGHEPQPEEKRETIQTAHELSLQKEPLVCKFEKRNGKPVTIIEGYSGSDEDFKILSKEIKTKFGVGGSFRGGEMLIQGDYRDKIMNLLKEKGFKTRRVGG